MESEVIKPDFSFYKVHDPNVPYPIDDLNEFKKKVVEVDMKQDYDAVYDIEKGRDKEEKSIKNNETVKRKLFKLREEGNNNLISKKN